MIQPCPFCNYDLGSGVYCGNCMARRITGSGIAQEEMNPGLRDEDAEIYTSAPAKWESPTLAKLAEVMREIPPIDPIRLDVFKNPIDPERMLVRARRKHSDTYYNVSAQAIAELEKLNGPE